MDSMAGKPAISGALRTRHRSFAEQTAMLVAPKTAAGTITIPAMPDLAP